MAKVKYFSDIDGAFELRNVHWMSERDFAERFPGVKGTHAKDQWSNPTMLVGFPVKTGGGLMPVTRIINYKSSPSLHACDARCVNAKSKTMLCECSCGGLNHGRGAFNRG